jgi:DNA-binding transcriptional regulator YiaG
MPNVASILKAEISRVARKEVRGETAALKKAVTAYRREIASLKRRTQALEQQDRQRSKAAVVTEKELRTAASDVEVRRFSAKGLRAQRKRLGLSAAEVGLLLGTTAQSVYNWEQGKARPSAKHMPGVVALRTLGKRAAESVLAARTQSA